MTFTQLKTPSAIAGHNRVVMAGTALALVALCDLLPGHNAALAAEPSGYEILPTLGGNSIAYSVSGDGRVVVGYSAAGSNSSRAVRWSTSLLEDLGTLGGVGSAAHRVNTDGSIIVGYAQAADGTFHAARWTAAGIERVSYSLGAGSIANDVNADGSVIVGTYTIGLQNPIDHAYRWTSAGVEDLGTLGGNLSYAHGVSADGSVVAGYSYLSNSSDAHAFRWTSAGMEDLGTLGGYSAAYSISADGSTIVGRSLAPEGARAFRWTEASGMESLGTLGGNLSSAHDANADGSVIVGQASGANSVSRAFRWTAETEMVSVEDWLRANGVTVASDFTYDARGVSDDGNVLVGRTDSLRPFIARVSDYGSGIIDVEQYMATLAGRPSSTQIGLGIAGTTMNGAHGEPMRNLLDVGRQSLQITTDAGYDNGSRSDGGVVISDLTYGLGLEGGITARLSAGGLYTKQDMDAGGDFKYHAFHIAPEVTLPVLDGFYATLGGYYSSGQIDINRGYLNGGVMDYSRGDADFDTWGAKLRFDWLNAFKANDWNFTPYTSLTYANARMDGYDEQGGGFASSFNSVRDHSTVLRLGLDAVTDITERVRLLGKVEADYRFENKTADVSGTIGGLSGFTLAGQDVDQFWLRGGFGAEFDTKAGTAFISLNASTQGDDPTVWVKSGWKVTF